MGSLLLLADSCLGLSDKLLAELLELDAEMTITLHVQTVDQAAAVKGYQGQSLRYRQDEGGGTEKGGALRLRHGHSASRPCDLQPGR